jgi:hypothetical protein
MTFGIIALRCAALSAVALMLSGCIVIGAAGAVGGAAVAVTGTAIGLGAKAVSATAHGVGSIVSGGKKDDKAGT